MLELIGFTGQVDHKEENKSFLQLQTTYLSEYICKPHGKPFVPDKLHTLDIWMASFWLQFFEFEASRGTHDTSGWKIFDLEPYTLGRYKEQLTNRFPVPCNRIQLSLQPLTK